MGRLVIVSNRVADPRKPASGGLAVAVGAALEAVGGAAARFGCVGRSAKGWSFETWAEPFGAGGWT